MNNVIKKNYFFAFDLYSNHDKESINDTNGMIYMTKYNFRFVQMQIE
jgi:hypothetical protein